MIKKITLYLFIFFFLQENIQAQTRKDFRLNIGFQGNFPEKIFNSSIPKSNNKNGGGGVHIYPKWFYNKNLSLGINMEYVLVTENATTDNIGTFDILSFSPTANYYFGNTKLRPFVGAGIGIYHVLNHTPSVNVGVKPLIGLSVYDYCDISLEYNKILNNIDINPNAMGSFDNYYFCLKGSFSIGLLNIRKE